MKSKPLNIRLPDSMKETLEDYAYHLDTSVSDIVTAAVRKELDHLRGEHGDVKPRPSRQRQTAATAAEPKKGKRK